MSPEKPKVLMSFAALRFWKRIKYLTLAVRSDRFYVSSSLWKRLFALKPRVPCLC